jgi:hypothetical protein
MAIDFDLENLRPSKGATPVSTGADDVRRPSLTAAADFAVSGNGTLVYVRDIAWSERRAVTPVWVGRKGQMVEPARTTPILLPRNFQLSRDDSGLVTMLGSPEKPEIWTYTFDDHAPVLLTKAGRYPVWYPDGRRVAFTSDHTGRWKLYSVASQGSEPKLVPTGDPSSNVSLTSMVPSLPLTFLDGRLVFGQGNISNGGDILVEPAGGGDKPQALVQTELSEDSARVSPDGKWLAYRTNRNLLSGEIWVQRLSNGRKIGDAQQISTKGGFEPVWSRGSNEVVLFYLEPDSPDGPINRPPKMMEVRLLPGGDSFGTPDPLFVSGYDHELVPRASWNFETTRSYDVDRKGRFLMVPRPPSSDVVPGIMRVVENWSEQLKRLAPAH